MCKLLCVPHTSRLAYPLQVYSHGQSEIILGNAIKKLNLPRDELVILTKVRIYALFLDAFMPYFVT